MTRLRPQIHNGLHWVRGELDQSLQRARQLIENHAENRGDPLPLQQAYVELHQVRGTASMIQCFGAAAAAEEMKQAAQDLINGRIAETEVAYSVLLGATVQLSDYIEALASGLDDCALVLQPMLNELRLSRGKNVLTEMDLFAGQLAALSLALPAPDADSRVPGAAQAQARKLLLGFQRAQLEWFKRPDEALVAVARMGKTGEQIANNTRSAPLYLMWRCFAACAEAMLARTLETSFELKRLFGNAGRQIKLLAEQGEDAAAAQLGELPYQFLFFVGRSRGQGPRVSGLRKVFALDAYLPATAQLEELRRRLKGPGAALLAKVADEIRNDLGQVKDAIDLAVRGGKGAPTLADTRARLKRIGDTLTVLGLQVLQRVVAAQARSLESVPEGQAVAPELWMEVATALLRVESSLEGALFRAIVRQRLIAQPEERPELEEDTPAPRDLREGRQALLRESLVNLARLKAGVDAYLKRGESAGLVEAARMLAEISAGFGILQSTRAAILVGQLERYVRSNSFTSLRDSQEGADRFADAIACVEYYLEAVRDELPDAERMLDDLGRFVEDLDMPAETPAPETLIELQAPEAVVAPAPPKPVDEVDPEIRDIFVEEAGEVRTTLESALPRWTRDPLNKDGLGVLRRAFHTLKGSGRMVGAKDIGEFGWAVENLLNRCLDGAISTGASVVDVVRQAVALLPDLIDCFRDGRPVPEALAPLVVRAQALASGQDGDAEPDMAAIFREDAREKLALTTAWLAGVDRSSIETRADQDAVRAFHTIKGSAAVVNAKAVSELAGALETWLDSAGGASMPLTAEALSLLDEACAQLLQWVGAAGTPAADNQDAKPWLTRIAGFQAVVPRGAIDDVAARQLHEIFAGEAFELVQKLESAAADWAAAPSSTKPPADLKFASHTLLGAALMSNCQPIATATRAIRDRVDEAIAQAAVPDAAFFAHLARIFEGLYQFLDSYREGKIESDGNDLALRIGGLAFTGEDMPPPAIPPAPPEAVVAAPAVAAEEFISLAAPDASDEELREIFLAEGQDLLQSLDAYSEAWEQNPFAAAPQAEIRRVLHTLKGSARMAGYGGISDVAHRLESLLDEATRSGPPSGTFFARLHFASDGLHHILDDLARGAIADTAGLLSELETPLRAPAQDLAPGVPAPEIAPEAEAEVIEMPMPEADAPSEPTLEPVSETVPELQEIEVTPVAEMAPAGPDADLAEIFSAEASELMEGLGHALDRWQSDPHDIAAMRDMQRALHTLKGGARMASLNAMGTAAHEMEERIESIEQGRSQADGDTFAQLRGELDQLQTMQDLLARGETQALTAERFVAPLAAAAILSPMEPEAAAPMEAPAAAAPVDRGPWDARLFWRPEDDSASSSALRRETARVAVEQLDSMLNQAGEISIYRSRLEEHNSGIGTQLNEMAAAIQRLREQLRMLDIETEAQIAARGLGPADNEHRYEAEFDPLEMDRYTRMQELSRALSESVGDLANLHGSMDDLIGEAETLLLQQGRINTQVQQGLMSTLMVPFSRQAARLQRVVKQTAQSEGKEAEVTFEGIESELDRNVLERMTAPLEHLLRNAVVHGIERPDVRAAAGKPPAGHVVVSLRREGTQLLIELRDDGQGLNLKAIREQAIRRGLMPADAQVADDALAQFIFEPGFSTAKTLTQAAGRGIGMDVVASEVKQLGGSLELGSEPGKGARFVIRLPLNLAISQALLVGVGNELYAVSLPSIEGIARIPRDKLDELYAEGGPGFSYGGHEYRVHYLGDLMGIARDRDKEQKTVSAILVRVPEGLGAQERRIAVTVDQLLGNREIVSKAVGPQVSSVMGVSGATILADGRVILILDVAALAQERLRRALISAAAAAGLPPEAAAVAPDADTRDLVMVVDDSITIRRVTERLLLKNGFRVVTAKDGLDAMAKLQTESPSVILLDIEMPRADGFEVAAFVRNNERIARTPIIMITSRSGEKHRERARSIGVNRYMIKPYQEEQLMAEIAGVKQESA